MSYTNETNVRKTEKSKLTIALAAMTALAASGASGAPIYWGAGGAVSPNNLWTTASNWYTDAAETSVSGSAPTAVDDVFFNSTPDNALGGTISVPSNIAAQSLTFNTSVATTLSQSGNRDFSLGAGGITLNSGGGNATLGTSTNTLSVQLTGNQTWTNNATSTLNVRSMRVSNTASGPVELTLNAASTGTISFSLGSNDSPDTLKALSIVVDSAGSGNVSMVGSSYTGGTTVKRGLLSMGGTTSTLGSGGISLGVVSGAGDARINLTGIATNAITVQSGTGLRALTGGNGDFQGDITLNNDVSIGSVSGTTQTLKVSGALSGTGNVKIGRVATGTSNPTVTLTGDSTYTGRTTIESATLVVDSLNSVVGGTATSALGAPTTVANGTISIGAVSASGLRYIGPGETTDRVIDLAGATNGVTLEQAGTGLLKFTSDFTATGNGSKSLTLRGSTAGTGEISGVIPNSSSNTGIVKSDTGTWRLSGLNTYTGTTQIGPSGQIGGVLEVTHLKDGALPSSIGQSSSSSGNLAFGGITAPGTLRYVGDDNTTTNRLFVIGGIGAVLESSGDGTVAFTNTGSPAYGSSNVATSLTLGGDNVGNNVYALKQNNNGSGAVSLTKNGIGTWVLTGDNTYTGATTINGGTLVVGNGVSGSLGNTAVAVNDTATLSGSGNIGGTVTVNAGGTLSPGNSPGLQQVGGLVLNDGGNYNWQVVNAIGSAGTGYDSYNVTGTLNLAALTGAEKFNINLWSLASTGPDVNGNAANFDNTLEQSWTLVATPNAIADFNSSYFQVNVGSINGTSGFSNALAGGTFAVGLGDGGTDLVLNFTPVPEPASLMLLGLGGLAMMRRRRCA